ncbi:MAG: hypothetical protein HYV60_07335, partial [Planctomycetia bacterium]|nr:hypothetical protein [Planctomycetia bacterium]
MLDRYDDPAAIWRFAQALGAFATDGDSDDARRLLNEAHKLDRRFVDYLLGDALVQANEPVRFDSRNKASHSTARLLLPAWRSVPGATAWVRRTLRLPPGKPQSALPFPRQQLPDLPR